VRHRPESIATGCRGRNWPSTWLSRTQLCIQFLTGIRQDQFWVTDITYIRTHEGWLYLAVVVDLFSRQVVGP